MKSGFNEGTTKNNSDLETDLLLAEKYGFDYIEFRLDKLETYLAKGSLTELERKLKQGRIRPHALNAIKGINLMSESAAKDSLARLEWACGLGKRLGSPCIVLVPTLQDGVHEEHARSDIDRDCVDVIERFSQVAASYDMGLALEPIGFRASAVRSLEQAWAILRRVKSKNVGLAVDTFNVHMFDSWNDIDVLKQIPVDRIFVVHIADCEDLPLGSVDQSNRLWPGEGIVPITKILSILHGMGYDGVVSLELFRPEYWQMRPEEVVRIGSERTRRYLTFPGRTP
ncbi:MAG: sugar phosphate isomerase/epimerase [Spirochaetia bacterium]